MKRSIGPSPLQASSSIAPEEDQGSDSQAQGSQSESIFADMKRKLGFTGIFEPRKHPKAIPLESQDLDLEIIDDEPIPTVHDDRMGLKVADE